MILDGNYSASLRITSALATLAKLHFKGTEAAKLDRLAREDGRLDFVEERVNKAVDLFAV